MSGGNFVNYYEMVWYVISDGNYMCGGLDYFSVGLEIK